MPIEFIQESQPTGSSGGNLFRLTMAYDGSGRRISKTRWIKSANSQDWEKELAGDNPIMRVDPDVNFDMQPSASSSTTDGY